jgi:type IX secretion system PorP/SprF family membrane protein
VETTPMMKKFTLLLSIVAISFQNSNAQDPFFVQNLNTRTFFNPAIAGTDSTLVVSFGYRNQLTDIDGSQYATGRFSADMYARPLRGGIALDALSDVEGPGSLTTKNIKLSYAPHFELFKHKLAVQIGLSAGYFEKSIDWNKVNAQSYTNGVFYFAPPNDQFLSNKSGWDFSTGIFMYTSRFYGGVGVFHLTQPDEGLLTVSKLPLKINVNVGANFLRLINSGTVTISPNIIFRKQQDVQELMLGLTAKIKWLVLGFTYENRDAYIFNAGLQFKYFKLGYSYDITTSKLTNASYGSHEVSLIGFIPYTRKPCKIKTIRFI